MSNLVAENNIPGNRTNNLIAKHSLSISIKIDCCMSVSVSYAFAQFNQDTKELKLHRCINRPLGTGRRWIKNNSTLPRADDPDEELMRTSRYHVNSVRAFAFQDTRD